MTFDRNAIFLSRARTATYPPFTVPAPLGEVTVPLPGRPRTEHFQPLMNPNPMQPLLLVSLLVASTAWCVISYRWRSEIRAAMKAYGGYLVRSLRAPGWVWLAALPVAWLAAGLPFDYDEAYTFQKFTSRTVLHSLATYPAPNNHVLHSLLTNVTWLLFGWTHSEIAVRLPAIACFLLTLAFISRVFLKGSHLMTACLVAVMFWSDSHFLYAFLARGYSMQSLFAVVGLAAVIDMPSFSPGRRLGMLLLTCILGLYTSPAYLYTAAPLGLMFIAGQWRWMLRFPARVLSMGVLAASTVLLLYAPILIREGPAALTSNRFVTPLESLSVPDMLRHASVVHQWVVLPGVAGILVTVFSLVNAFRLRQASWMFVLIAPLVMMLFLRQLPFERVFQPVGTLILAYACMGLGSIIAGRSPGPWVCVPLAAACVVPTVLRYDARYSGEAIYTASAMKRILGAVEDKGPVYAWKLHWLYLDGLHARDMLKGKRFATDLADTTTVFPNSGMLLSTRRIHTIPCVDSVLWGGNTQTACYIYRLP